MHCPANKGSRLYPASSFCGRQQDRQRSPVSQNRIGEGSPRGEQRRWRESYSRPPCSFPLNDGLNDHGCWISTAMRSNGHDQTVVTDLKKINKNKESTGARYLCIREALAAVPPRSVPSRYRSHYKSQGSHARRAEGPVFRILF